MEKEILNSYSKLDSLNVSRETYLDFELFISMLIEKNKQINVISQESAKNEIIRDRHIVDSAQIIDLVDLNYNTTCDLGTGGGMPGIIIAIMLKNMKKSMKVQLYEKSHHKSNFLREVSRKLKLNTEIFQENVFDLKKMETGTIMCRAFKPMPDVLDLIYENFLSYANLILFMGTKGKDVFKNSLRYWDLEYTEKKSLTNKNSFLLNIKKISKKN